MSPVPDTFFRGCLRPVSGHFWQRHRRGKCSGQSPLPSPRKISGFGAGTAPESWFLSKGPILIGPCSGHPRSAQDPTIDAPEFDRICAPWSVWAACTPPRCPTRVFQCCGGPPRDTKTLHTGIPPGLTPGIGCAIVRKGCIHGSTCHPLGAVNGIYFTLQHLNFVSTVLF